MRKKTDFQIKCSSILLKKMNEFNLNLKSWEFIDGNKESYFEGDVGYLKVWVYEDGACIIRKNSAKAGYIYEMLDYKDEDDLINAFIGKFSELIKNS